MNRQSIRKNGGIAKIILCTLVGTALVQELRAESFPLCTSQNGEQVTLYKTTSSEGGPAFATMAQGKPIIVFNEQLMNQYAHSAGTRLFIYLHECGHQALGHTLEESRSHRHTNEEELAADCYAAQQIRASGATRGDLDVILQDLKLLRKDPDHPGHVKRISNVIECFGE